MLKFLIDECLSLNLVEVARDRGFTQSSHVVWLGKAGWKDWELKPFILDGDWTFVTRDLLLLRPSAKGRNPATTYPKERRDKTIPLASYAMMIH